MKETASSWLDESAIVAAHPDDEILWFSSILGKVGQVLICFGPVESEPGWTEGRRRSLQSYPLKNVEAIELTESGVFWGVDWNAIQESEFGLEITDNRYSDSRYRQNYRLLVEALETRLNGVRTVITHNPWGEYGHVEHVQVFRAVKALQEKMGFDLWFSNYCSNRTVGLLKSWSAALGDDPITMATDKALANQIAGLYKENGCWTWYPDYAWCDTETFFRYGSGPGIVPGTVAQMNLVLVEPADRRRAAGRQKRSIWKRIRGAAKRLKGGRAREAS